MRLKHVNGAKTERVVMRRTNVLLFHQVSPNHPSSIPAWWIPYSFFPAKTSPFQDPTKPLFKKLTPKIESSIAFLKIRIKG